MKRIGITGQHGFVGSHLFNTLGLSPEEYQRIDFQKEYFENPKFSSKYKIDCRFIQSQFLYGLRTFKPALAIRTSSRS